MDILNEPIAAVSADVKYGGFWPRIGASLIDALALSPITFGVAYFNITEWKSVAILILLNAMALIYKPYMEYTYHATLGKMALNLKVVTLESGTPSLGEVLLRNIFHMGGVLLSLIFSIVVFTDPGFQEISGFMEFSAFTQTFVGPQVVNWILMVVVLIDVIILVADDRSRSWHDKIAKTFVIQQP
jgi:uncharacterized RDD family membrane protein YckC